MGWKDWFRPKERPQPITDADLGVLNWSAEDGGWTGTMGGLRFTLGDEDDAIPSEDLREWASQVLSDTAFLQESLASAVSEAPDHLQQFSEEMDALRYEHLYFSENSNGRYIFATLGPGRDYRCWRLEFDGQRCLGIGFDS
jgi:hypothetical protein